MKTVVNGRLAKEAKYEEVMIKNGENAGTRVPKVTFTLFAPDPNGPETKAVGKDGKEKVYNKGIALQCAAWGEDAEKIKNMPKGETVTGSATVRYGGNAPQFVISKLDPENRIHKQMNRLITAYQEGEIDQFFEEEMEKEPPFRSNDLEAAKEFSLQAEAQTEKENEAEMSMN